MQPPIDKFELFKKNIGVLFVQRRRTVPLFLIIWSFVDIVHSRGCQGIRIEPIHTSGVEDKLLRLLYYKRISPQEMLESKLLSLG